MTVQRAPKSQGLLIGGQKEVYLFTLKKQPSRQKTIKYVNFTTVINQKLSGD